MPAVLQKLKFERDKYDKARRALINAKTTAERISGNVSETIGFIEDGISVGGTGLQLYRLSEMEEYIDLLENYLSTAITYCGEKYDKLRRDVVERENFLNSILLQKANTNLRNGGVVSAVDLQNYAPVSMLKE